MKKEIGFLILFIIFCFIGVFSIGFYFYKFSGGLSLNHTRWGEFGSFIGGILSPIVGILAFIGLFYNLELTKKQFKKENEDNTFFNMIDLHNKKVESTSFIDDTTEIKSFHAFKEYTLEYNKMYDLEFSRIARREIASNYKDLSPNAYMFIWEKFHLYFNEKEYYSLDNKKIISFFEKRSVDDNLENIKAVIGTEESINSADYDKMVTIGLGVMYDYPSLKRVETAQRVHDFFYEKYGHVLGHYFRNIHYMLDFIDNSKESVRYSKVFRAQLSRYELTLIYYNALSSMSSVSTVELLLKYDILNGLYSPDISYSPDIKMIKEDLETRLKK
jgi:hypothetical protein